MQLQGVGNASEGAAFTHIASIGVGSAVVRNQYVLVLPIATGFGVAEGLHIDGMLGYQFLARFVTTIDYAGGKITLKMPAAAPPSPRRGGAGRLLHRRNDSAHSDHRSRRDDTARSTREAAQGLRSPRPSLQRIQRSARWRRPPPVVAGFGIGGPSFARLGRVPSTSIGPYDVANSVVDFTEQSKGAFADPYNPANIGGAIWRRFTVTFDYRHQQMFLAKNADFDAPFGYDRSGLFLVDANGAFTVLSALVGSPATNAGLDKGDVIVSVNGSPVSSTTLAGLRTMLAGPAGTVVHLHVRTGTNERDVTLTLADYV